MHLRISKTYKASKKKVPKKIAHCRTYHHTGVCPGYLFFKNLSRTGAHGIMSKSSLLIPAVTWLPWVVSTNPGSPLCWIGVTCWDVEILSCSISEELSVSRVPGLTVLLSCVSGYQGVLIIVFCWCIIPWVFSRVV